VPAGLSGSPQVTVTFNGKTHTFATTFTVNIVSYTVTGIDKSVVSPVEKQNLVISVSHTPSSTASHYIGVLVSSERTIYMKINSVDTSAKTLTARFPGAPKAEQFTLFVDYSGERYNSAVFLTTAAKITGVEITTTLPTFKSTVGTTGGDTVKLTGEGFSSNIDDNIVVFGSIKTEVVSATLNEIVVRTGASASTGELEITAFLKPNIEMICAISGGCKITYAVDSSLTLATNTVTHADGVITITGAGFGLNAKGFIGDYEQTTVSSTSTEIQLRLTMMNDPESIDLIVRTDTVNIPKMTVSTPFDPVLLSVSPKVGSSGGQKITLTTVGLGLKTTSNLNVLDSTSSTIICKEGTITLVDSSTVTCITKHGQSVTKSALKLIYTHRSSTTGETSTKTLTCATSTDCEYETTTAATPTISSLNTSGTSATASVNSFTFDNTYTVKVHYGDASVGATSVSFPSVTAEFTTGFTPGVVPVRISFEKNGQITYTSKYENTISLSATLVGTPLSCSWAGGCDIVLSQNGLTTGARGGDVKVTVCGNTATARVTDSSTNQLILSAPAYVTTHSLDQFGVESAYKITGTATSFPSDFAKLAFDGITNVSPTSTGSCHVQVKFTDGMVGRVTKVRYFMNRMVNKQTNFVNIMKFQSSSDGSTWTDVFAAATDMREGWNEYTQTSVLKKQYYRFYSSNNSACQIAEIELWGNEVEDSTATSKTCDVVVTVPGGETQTFAGGVVYKDSATSKVTKITPRYGNYKGGETITFEGTGFSSAPSEAKILIDGVECSVTSATSTAVQCTTGARPSINANPSTILTFSGSTQNGHASMQGHSYRYANYWSDIDTWSGEFKPQDGNTVVIPQGQTLIFDEDSSPVLKAVLVQGAFIFAPDTNPAHERTFDAEYIFIDKGATLEIGTEEFRYTSKLTITMHGTRESPQLPVYGNKGIFVRHGQLDIHGVKREHTWTELKTTLAAGSDTATLNVKTDWAAGERIVVAPTDFEVDHAEEFTIVSVDNSGATTVLKLDRPAMYKHFAGSKDYTGTNSVSGSKTKTLEMRAEVGLLSRNVVYKGADDDSVARQYGAHIMLHSKGDDSLTGRISYAEFTQVGQAFQLGRYPIHFHMIGAVHNSYIEGNAIHHTYNRAVTTHGVHYLTVKKNVAYETMGHTFFIEDAIETHNSYLYNLAVKTKRSWSLLNTDQTPASFWITHPNNIFIGNHAAGSDRYGFWFDLQTHPIGPSADPNICPEYEVLGEFTGNVAHSNGRYGLRIFHRFTPVENPCAALAGGAFNNREQPDSTISPPIKTKFTDFLGYKNKRTGIIAEELGAVTFENIRVADNLFSGVEFGITQAGPWREANEDYHLQDALIVAASDNAEEFQTTHADVTTTGGLKGARTEKMRIKDTIFANFNHDGRWGAIRTCSHCEGPATDSSGRTYFTKNLYFIDSTQRVKFDIPFKEIIYDEDGTLGNDTHRWVVFYFEHLNVPECIRNEGTYNGLLCSKDISIRRVVFHHGKPDNALKNLPMKVMNTNKIVASSRRNLAVSPSTCPTVSSSVSTLDAIDVTAKGYQDLLLGYYDSYAKNKTERDNAIAAFDSSGSASDQAAVSTYQSNLDSLQLLIDEYKSKVDAERGKYDNLWKTDMNFCNTNNYGLIEYRGKANPKNNWVFNVITGYEYKVHIAQGADFDSMTGEYSYAKLLNGETAAAMLHFNFTERTEAFKFKYTDSSTNTLTELTEQTSPMALSNTALAMGDFFMNNVTRHMTMKLDGQNNDRLRFDLSRHECITVGGCGLAEAFPSKVMKLSLKALGI
jgi:hypothetical protein